MKPNLYEVTAVIFSPFTLPWMGHLEVATEGATCFRISSGPWTVSQLWNKPLRCHSGIFIQNPVQVRYSTVTVLRQPTCTWTDILVYNIMTMCHSGWWLKCSLLSEFIFLLLHLLFYREMQFCITKLNPVFELHDYQFNKARLVLAGSISEESRESNPQLAEGLCTKPITGRQWSHGRLHGSTEQ